MLSHTTRYLPMVCFYVAKGAAEGGEDWRWAPAHGTAVPSIQSLPQLSNQKLSFLKGLGGDTGHNANPVLSHSWHLLTGTVPFRSPLSWCFALNYCIACRVIAIYHPVKQNLLPRCHCCHLNPWDWCYEHLQLQHTLPAAPCSPHAAHLPLGHSISKTPQLPSSAPQGADGSSPRRVFHETAYLLSINSVLEVHPSFLATYGN